MRDQINLLRRLTPRRLSNALRAWISFHVSRWMRKPVWLAGPISVSVEPTTACNLGCPECPSGLKKFTRPTGNLKPELFERILDQLGPQLIWMTFYFQGEPFIHPQFTELVAKARKRGVYTATSTNAHFLDHETAERAVKSGLDRLIISIDGITQETYEQYRVHGRLDKVLEGTRNILEARKKLRSRTPYVVFQFLVVRPNEHQVEDARRLADELGVDAIHFKTAQVYDYENGNPLIPENPLYGRYEKGPGGKWRIKNKLLNQCWRMWHGCVITWDGLVVPCCFDKDAQHRMGDLKTNGFTTIWRGESYRSFRQKILQSRKEIDICTNCTEGTKVKAEVS
jgi:radical SAM protein with 4Fe4S-binding SPASM domain